MPGPDAATGSPPRLLAEPELTAKRWEAAAGLRLHPGGLRPGTCRKPVPTSRVTHAALPAGPVETHHVAPFKFSPSEKEEKKSEMGSLGPKWSFSKRICSCAQLTTDLSHPPGIGEHHAPGRAGQALACRQSFYQSPTSSVTNHK